MVALSTVLAHPKVQPVQTALGSKWPVLVPQPMIEDIPLRFYIDEPSRGILYVDRGTNGELWITSVSVPPEHCGRGVGTMLVKRACRDADDHGAELWLGISPAGAMGHEDLRRWYQKFGFEDVPMFGEARTYIMRRRPQGGNSDI